MRFQLVHVLAALAVALSLAAPTADQGKGLINLVTTDLQLKAGENSLEDQASSLDSINKRGNNFEFVFTRLFGGLVHETGGVSVSFLYKDRVVLMTVYNHLSHQISAQVKDYTKGIDVIVLPVPSH
ncbi:uncharacterized protein EKO05_0006145 [Ascochyta rabiei]|uniref:uncharacterized protein n=1 Tax=Didymella rabiei TaxID=5454 RepID=UPI0022036ECE|nr:uncharacterized protein EKO05_0006145 [Ascochyta rabiei]UPX15705.1 hypothetical protein EKO05_0006145 [Ascochyta rabiei]